MMMPAGREAASHVRGSSEPHILRPPSERVTVHALFSRCVRVRPLLENRTGPLRLHEAGGGGGRQAVGSGGGGALGAKGPGAGSHRPWSQPRLGTGPERLRCLRFMEVHKHGSARFVQDPTSRKLNHREGLDTASLLWGWNPRLGGGPRARSYGVLNRSPSGTRFYRRPELKGPPFLSLIISCGFRIIP